MNLYVKPSPIFTIISKQDKTITIKANIPTVVLNISKMGTQGIGVPRGGKEGNLLVKKSDKNFDTIWTDKLNNIIMDAGDF